MLGSCCWIGKGLCISAVGVVVRETPTALLQETLVEVNPPPQADMIVEKRA